MLYAVASASNISLKKKKDLYESVSSFVYLWKQRIQFYPLANEAVQKSSIYISSTVAMSLFPNTVIIFLSLH